MKTTSYVIREKASKRVLFETFQESIALKINTSKYEAVPILAYLQELNRSLQK